MSTFAIRSVRDELELILGPVKDSEGHYYDVRVNSPVVNGQVKVYDHHASQLADFFAELAGLWRKGWDGEKEYRSLEGQLSLVATRNRTGHVFLKVELWDGMGGPDFNVGATLVLEAGQLELIASGVRGALGVGGAV